MRQYGDKDNLLVGGIYHRSEDMTVVFSDTHNSYFRTCCPCPKCWHHYLLRSKTKGYYRCPQCGEKIEELKYNVCM